MIYFFVSIVILTILGALSAYVLIKEELKEEKDENVS